MTKNTKRKVARIFICSVYAALSIIGYVNVLIPHLQSGSTFISNAAIWIYVGIVISYVLIALVVCFAARSSHKLKIESLKRLAVVITAPGILAMILGMTLVFIMTLIPSIIAALLFIEK